MNFVGGSRASDRDLDISQFNCINDHMSILNNLYSKWPKDRIIHDKSRREESGTGAISIRDNLIIPPLEHNQLDAYLARAGSVESKDSVFDLN